jgi:hypothetical protein
MSRPLAACCLALLAAAPARGQAPGEPIRLTLHPAAPSSPALRYRLLPELIEQAPGNAAELYKKAVPLLKVSADDDKQFDEWEKLAPERLPVAEVRRVLATYQEGLDLIDRGARREYCDWGLPERLRMAGVNAVLPEIQPMRVAARLLAVRARAQIAEGQFEPAARTIRTGLALAKHVGESATLISCLVGNAIANVMAGQLDLFVQQPKAPNLYWPLTDLPRPFLDMRRPLQGERVMAYGTFPGMAEVIADPHAGPLPPEQLAQFSKMFLYLDDRNPLRTKATLAVRLQKKHEAAKRSLVEAGRPRELVEQLPHVQVALLHAFAEYERYYEEALKWETFPYAEAAPHLRETVARMDREVKKADDRPAFDLVGSLMPAMQKVFSARARLDRKFAALRCVEAVRLYAAAHGGKLPPALGDIKEVPVPDDPLTGKPFEYRVEGDKATLVGPLPEDLKGNPAFGLRYELTMRR